MQKQKVKEITDKLEEGLKELFESEKYKSYLSTISKFHNYSFNNTLLIALQRPDATLVAGYQAWQKNFNRHVNKGEREIRILALAPYIKEVFIMATSSITKNFVISGKEQVEMFVNAIEESAKNRPFHIPVAAREITDEAEQVEFMTKWEKANVGNK